MTTELCVLAKKYGSDKCPDIFHYYTPIYHTLLNPLRDNTILFLEIGIGYYELMKNYVGESYKSGASLRMWRDYFHNATVVGCDINTSVLFNNEERIRTFYTDQSSETSLLNLITSNIQPMSTYIDILLDDGSHNEDHQRISFKILWPFVRPNGGIYIIEDIPVEHLHKFHKFTDVFGFNDVEILDTHRDTRDAQWFIVFRKKAV